MARVRVRAPEAVPNGHVDGPVGEPTAVRVSGLVLDKREAVRLLRCFVPQLVDVEATEDGRFLLTLGAEGGHDDQAAR